MSDRKEITYDKDIFPEISEIIRIRNSIAKMNLPNLYNLCKGAFFSRMKNLKNGTESTKELVKKHGYDTKRALHAYRYLDLIIRFANINFNDFIYAIRYERKDEKEFMLSIKNGNYSIDEFSKVLEIKYKLLKSFHLNILNKKRNWV